jgi:hypothetical protein
MSDLRSFVGNKIPTPVGVAGYTESNTRAQPVPAHVRHGDTALRLPLPSHWRHGDAGWLT